MTSAPSADPKSASALSKAPSASALAAPWYFWPQPTTVHLVSTNIHERDGIGNFVLDSHRLLKGWGVPCEMYAVGCESALQGTVKPLATLTQVVQPRDIVFVHFSIFLPELAAIAALDCQKVLYYHGITPPSLLTAYDAHLADQCRLGYEQRSLMRQFQHVAANSAASAVAAREYLDDATTVTVIPPVLNLTRWEAIAAEPMPLSTHPRKFLSVGRVVPHKKIEDLIRLYGAYHALDPQSCLLIAGAHDFAVYSAALQQELAAQPEAVQAQIHFLGSVSDGQLKFLYETADALWMMSEHEGFCIPLLEAMGFEMPVFAFAQTAVRETLGESGLMFYHKDMSQLAQGIQAALSDEGRSRQLIAQQNQRLQQLRQAGNGRAIWQLLESCLREIYASSL